jgi:Flp pilus assembly protein TadG
LVLPVLLILVFGTLEVCQRLILRESAAVAAYEAARRAARRNVSAADAIERGESILQGRGISNGVIALDPASLSEVPTGGEFEVRVTVPVENNTTVHYVLPLAGEITVVATMLRE